MGIVSQIKKMISEINSDKEDLRVIANDYFKILKFLLNDKDAAPEILSFNFNNPLFLSTNYGDINLRDISEDEITYSICRKEIQDLFCDISYSEKDVINFVNKHIKKNW